MRTLLRRAAVAIAAATATAGPALPASAAPAKPAVNWVCPLVVGVCATGADGELRMIFHDEAVIVPPVVRAVNHTPDHWCFYSSRGFAGERREVAPGEVVHDFGFDVWSARNGYCDW